MCIVPSAYIHKYSDNKSDTIENQRMHIQCTMDVAMVIDEVTVLC